MRRPADTAVTTVPVRISGTTASPGFARGPLHLLGDIAETRRPAWGSVQSEASMLRAALTAATGELADVMRRTADADAQALLEFQIAMLEDDSLVAPAFEAIAAGAPADAAWRDVLEHQVQDYRAAGDAYFAARASDLQDMRDRVLRCMGAGEQAAVPPGAIVVGSDLAPSRFLEIAWAGGGIALFAGSPHSHVATLARARGVPMIVRMVPAVSLPAGDVLLDAEDGVLIAAPDSQSLETFEARRSAARATLAAESGCAARPARTADGERVRVLLNIARIDDLAAVPAAHCDGIGLVRTELLLRNAADLLDEEWQFDRYREISAWAGERPVIFRTVDAGGDKPIEGYTTAGEANPFLGVRGIRLSLLHPRVLTVQLRALARAAAFGQVSIMIPMVTRPEEFERVRNLLDSSVAELRAGGVACGSPELGMMVEVPAAALTIDTFSADFFSIGSNDLVAYTAAAGRDSEQLADLLDPLAPAVMRLIRGIIRDARAANRPVSLCGDMAGDPRCVPALLGAGLRSFSIAPSMVSAVKAAIARFRDVPVD